MNFFKNPLVAVLLAVIVVAGSTLVNTDVKLGEACQAAEDAFYTNDGSAKSIYSRLDARLDAANGLWTIIQNYNNSEAIDLSAARGTLLSARENRDISDMFAANKALQSAFDSALASLGKYSLDSGEKEAVESYATTFAGAQKMIDESKYNENVLEFQRGVLDKFPASVLKGIVGIDEPELFQ